MAAPTSYRNEAADLFKNTTVRQLLPEQHSRIISVTTDSPISEVFQVRIFLYSKKKRPSHFSITQRAQSVSIFISIATESKEIYFMSSLGQ